MSHTKIAIVAGCMGIGLSLVSARAAGGAAPDLAPPTGETANNERIWFGHPGQNFDSQALHLGKRLLWCLVLRRGQGGAIPTGGEDVSGPADRAMNRPTIMA